MIISKKTSLKNNKKKIYFSKMHGTGNDFVIINNIKNKNFFSNVTIKNLSNRNTGIGFDQFLLLEKSKIKNIDFFYRIFNSNGKEVYQCGNGVRCIAKFIFIENVSNKKKICVSTKKSIMFLEFFDKNNIKVNMGIPIFKNELIPFQINQDKKKYFIQFNNKKIHFYVVSMGNPHCVILVKDINRIKIDIIGKFFNENIYFPKGVNVNFVEIIDRNNIKLRVYERGVGETLSCGSGACASAAIGILNNFLNKTVRVSLKGGDLNILWNGEPYSLYMIGPASMVYKGFFYL